MATLDLNHALANILLEDVATAFPAGSVLELRTGTSPGAENAATGTLVAEITLPATPWLAAASGVLAKSGTWEDPVANASDTIAYYRLKNAGDTRRIDGVVSGTGGGGDIVLTSTAVVAGQSVLMSSYQYSL